MKSMRILIVDDDRDFAESIADLVDMHGHMPILAYSGEDALDKLKNNGIDIVFMDIKMPGMNGIETFAEIRKLQLNIQVAMMTGYSDQHDISRVLADGAINVLRKPIDFDEFITTVNGV